MLHISSDVGRVSVV